jgi:hypothetical protein
MEQATSEPPLRVGSLPLAITTFLQIGSVPNISLSVTQCRRYCATSIRRMREAKPRSETASRGASGSNSRL